MFADIQFEGIKRRTSENNRGNDENIVHIGKRILTVQERNSAILHDERHIGNFEEDSKTNDDMTDV